jgi:Putative peptidoglycan binding domain
MLGRTTHRLRAGALAGALALLALLAIAEGASAGGGGTGTGLGGGGGGTGVSRHHHHGRHHRGGGDRRAAGDANGPLAGQGMWIWYVSHSGGTAGAIAKRAHAYGIDTVFIKSSDGSSEWSQFTPRLVSALHARHINVCAWQFVYGSRPRAEATLGADAEAEGADCLAIDAESQYEGRYRAASIYMKRLRALAGRHFPVALASFPYVDYHPGLPYSVFLGPGGAQKNAPQVYWHAIGTSPGRALHHTFVFNRVYQRALVPLGQTYGGPPLREVRAFRKFAFSYGFKGLSWWSWQETQPAEWRVLASRIHRGVPGFRRTAAFPQLHKGSAGDLVVWAQEHLLGAGDRIKVDGDFGNRTRFAVEDFQSRRGLPITGAIGRPTWRALLKVRPVAIDWSRPHASLSKAEAPRRGIPRSASLPAVRREVPTRPPGN